MWSLPYITSFIDIFYFQVCRLCNLALLLLFCRPTDLKLFSPPPVQQNIKFPSPNDRIYDSFLIQEIRVRKNHIRRRIQTQNDSGQPLWAPKKNVPKNDRDFFLKISRSRVNKTYFKLE